MAGEYKDLNKANALRWTPGEENYYEIYYLTLNHLASRSGFWIRYTIHAPQGDPNSVYAEVWFTYYNLDSEENNFGIMKQFPIDALDSSADPFSLRIGDCRLENGACFGGLEGKGHSGRWDLEFESGCKPFLHFPEHLYTSGEVDSAMLSPHFSTRFTGTIEVDGRLLELKDDPGEQSKTWGRCHPPHWLWCHCNHFEEDSNAAMELVCAPSGDEDGLQIHVLYAKCHGEEFRLLSLLDGSKSESDAAPGTWRLRAESATVLVEAEVTCRLEDIAEAVYRDPNGTSAFCANTIVASSRLQISTRPDDSAPWQPLGALHSNGTTHAEWGDDAPHEDVHTKIMAVL